MARGSAFNRFLDRCAGIPLSFLLGLARKRKSFPPARERVVAVLFGALGDTTLLLPLLYDLHVAKDVKILFVCSTENAPLLAGVPFIDVLVFDLSRLFTDPLYLLRIRKQISAFSPDLLLDFNPWARISGIVGHFVFDGWTAGFRTANQARHFLYDVVADHSALQHERHNYLALVRTAFPGLEPGTGFRLPLADADNRAAIALLERCNVRPGSFVVFHPWSGGYRREQKEWSREKNIRFLEDMDRAGVQVCVTGTVDDLPFAGGFPFRDDRIVSLIGRVSFGELLCVLFAAKAVVSVNTGIMHLAANLDVPLFVLDGPAGPVRWGPVSTAFTQFYQSTLPCSPCLDLGFEYPCRGRKKCMETTDPAGVAKDVIAYCAGTPNLRSRSFGAGK